MFKFIDSMFNKKTKEEQTPIGDQIQEQSQSQAIIQSFDDIFHTVIIALERLELYLMGVEGQSGDSVNITARNSDRDLHNDQGNPPSKATFYKEVQLDIMAITTSMDDLNGAEFDEVTKFFLRDVLEWYGGRANLPFNDVERFAVPLLAALNKQLESPIELLSVVKEYVLDLSTLTTEKTDDEKEVAIVDVWNKYQVAIYESSKFFAEFGAKQAELTSHKRSDWQGGYERLKLAFTEFYPEDELPLSKLEQIVETYFK